MPVMNKDELTRAKQNRDMVDRAKHKTKDLVHRKYMGSRPERPMKERPRERMKVVQKPVESVFDELRRKLGK